MKELDPPLSHPEALAAKLQAAFALHQKGELDGAAVGYNEILELQPRHFDALQLLATVAAQKKDSAAAVELFDRALKVIPDHASTLCNRAVALHDLQRFEEALESYDRALRINPDSADALNSRGNVLVALARSAEALDSYDRALRVRPDHAEALNNRGSVLVDLKRPAEALDSYDRALKFNPDYGEAYCNRGTVLVEMRRLEEALDSFDSALRLEPRNARALNDRGSVLVDLKRPAEALKSYDRALAIKPDYAEASYNRGNAYLELRRLEEALASYDRALQIKPDYVKALNNRGIVLAKQGKRDEALAEYRKALALDPRYAQARWALVMNTIPAIAGRNDNPVAHREEFARELAAMDAWFDAEQIDGHERVGQSTPFYLAYQEIDNRDLLSSYGTLCARLMKRWQDRQDIVCPVTVPGRVKRVGIISAHIRSHPVWNAILKGWFRHLDRNRVELHVFNLGFDADDETNWARSRSASFKEGNYTLRQWVDAIVDKRLDALVYPEVGMNSMTIKLASLRLARVQVAAWGHPETTGLPTIDYYLSAESFEPPGATGHYTEQLIALPNLGCCYTPLPVTGSSPDMAELGINPKVPLLICPGTPFKYAPQNDSALVDIARKLGNCQMVFFENPIRELSGILRSRLEVSFREAGMRFADYGVLVPWQSPSAFYGLMKRADVFLDTIGFSGFNTAMQAVECGLPLVTREGRFMRGRLASGILRRMGLQELVTDSNERYVDLAVKLATDRQYRVSVQQKLEASRDSVFNDFRPVRALEDFLEYAVQRK